MKSHCNLYYFTAIFIFMLCVFPQETHAIGINKMFAIADSSGRTTYTINSNNHDERLFLSIEVSELEIDKEQVNKIKYDRSNIDDWKIKVNPTRTILEPDFDKDITVSMLCGSDCPEEEMVFQLHITPSPYFDNIAKEKNQSDKNIDFVIGLSPVFIKPGPEDNEFIIDVIQGEESLIFYNQGRGFNYIVLEDCQKSQKECEKHEYILLANRMLEVPIPKDFSIENLNITAFSNQRRYSEQLQL